MMINVDQQKKSRLCRWSIKGRAAYLSIHDRNSRPHQLLKSMENGPNSRKTQQIVLLVSVRYYHLGAV